MAVSLSPFTTHLAVTLLEKITVNYSARMKRSLTIIALIFCWRVFIAIDNYVLETEAPRNGTVRRKVTSAYLRECSTLAHHVNKRPTKGNHCRVETFSQRRHRDVHPFLAYSRWPTRERYDRSWSSIEY